MDKTLKTNKLIRCFINWGILLLIVKYVFPFYMRGKALSKSDYMFSHKSEISEDFCALFYLITSVALVGLILLSIVVIYSSWTAGDYDKLFKQKTEPILTKICNFINRKNNTDETCK